MRHFSIAMAAAASALAYSQMAYAADMPLKAPPPLAVASGNWYVWLDGMYEKAKMVGRTALGVRADRLADPRYVGFAPSSGSQRDHLQ